MVGHVSWWVFVVTALFNRGPMGSGPRRYADYVPVQDRGWTAYTPLTGSLHSPPSDGFTALNILSTLTVVAAVITVAAAVAEGLLGRRWMTGLLTVGAPLLGGALVLVASHGGFGDWYLLLVAALCGVAIREVWSRAFAPTRLPRPDRIEPR